MKIDQHNPMHGEGKTLIQAKLTHERQEQQTNKQTNTTCEHAFVLLLSVILNDVRECIDQCADCFWVANLIGPLQEWNGLGHPGWEDMNYNNNSQFAWISAWFLGRPMRPIHVQESHSINDLSVKLKTDPKYCVSSQHCDKYTVLCLLGKQYSDIKCLSLFLWLCVSEFSGAIYCGSKKI